MRDRENGPIRGRIEEGAAGFGVPSVETVEQRAIEIAVIAGRSAGHVTEADRDQARRELLGEGSREPEEDDAMIGASGALDEPPGSTGQHIASLLPEDEANIGERLVQEGVDEALHDEMLQARKKNIDAAS